MNEPLINVILNNKFYLDRKYLSNRGFILGDRIIVSFSPQDNCFYIKKFKTGTHKLSLASEKAVKFTDTVLYRKLKLEDKVKYTITLYQDSYDKSNNSIKCIINE